MDFELDEAQQAWREEVRAFLKESLTTELVRQGREIGYEQMSPEMLDFRKKVGDKGWFGLNWLKEYGGLGLGPVYQRILINEFEYAGAPALDLTVTSVAPMIMRNGTEKNKEEWLPPIARGDLTVAVGYSEPNSGTDLASLKTKAVLDGDEWVINGQKIWNSNAHYATHEWLCVRTDPDAPKHRGISVIMVPIDTPGIEVRPLVTWGDYQTNEAFFTNVRVPQTNLIGEVNKGWQYMTGALDLERGSVTHTGDLRREVNEVIDAAQQTLPDGSRPIDRADIRRRIAQLEADVEVAELLGFEAASMFETGQIPTVTVTAEKIFASELGQRIADLGTEMLGMWGVLALGDPDAVEGGAFERLYRFAPLPRFAGGTNDVLRDVIAQRGHGMQRHR